MLRASPVLLLLAALVLVACGGDEPARPDVPPGALIQQPDSIPFTKHGELQIVRPDGRVIADLAIEIADSDSATQRGLMQRSGLPEDSGMLFIFPNPRPLSFYMANTPLSLDIMFFSPDSVFLNAATYTQPFSPENLTSEGIGQFVLETEAGFVDQVGLTQGDRITWTRTDR
ncbi:MAG: DUF192 domain-containing protein [Planctomycetota bacterium]